MGAGRSGMGDLNGVINELARRQGAVFRALHRRPYRGKAEWQNGAFTKALVVGSMPGDTRKPAASP